MIKKAIQMIIMPLIFTEVLIGVSFTVSAQQVIKEKDYQLIIPMGWEKTTQLPAGVDVGFRKKLESGDSATFCFHHEYMPPEMGDPPSNTSGMKNQWDSIVRNQYPDMTIITTSNPKVDGRILINGKYQFNENGVKVQRRYTYFLSNRTAFVVLCTAPPAQWANAENDFDTIIASLKAGGSISKAEVKSDDSAKGDLKRNIPILLSSFPSNWACSLSDVGINIASDPEKRILEIKLAFSRTDISDIYKATKQIFEMMKSGKSDIEINKFISQPQSHASQGSEFIKYIGQIWGLAYNYIFNINPPIAKYNIILVDRKDQKIGAISISKADASAILTGKVTESDEKRLANMYVFE